MRARFWDNVVDGVVVAIVLISLGLMLGVIILGALAILEKI